MDCGAYTACNGMVLAAPKFMLHLGSADSCTMLPLLPPTAAAWRLLPSRCFHMSWGWEFCRSGGGGNALTEGDSVSYHCLPEAKDRYYLNFTI
jgi:hypothetical protein